MSLERAEPFRLAAGGEINRSRPLAFRFNGERLFGYEGDTLASALLAHGRHLVGRSFKYHRPRGIVAAGAEEMNALVQLDSGAATQPNLRATQVELYEGLKATSQNCWPSLEFDVGAINNAMSRFIPSGFYYKTFMWPPSLWMFYEHFIRSAAGLGKVPEGRDPDTYDKMHAHCDVLVVGAGPAGLAAALSAARAGARVLIADERHVAGGSLPGNGEQVDGQRGAGWARAMIAELQSHHNVRVLMRTTVSAFLDHGYLIAAERRTDHLAPGALPHIPRQRMWKIRAKQVITATGAHERPMVFANNDRPGVMMANAAQTYVNQYAVRPGDKAVVFANNNAGWGTALSLSDAGVDVTLVDSRGSASSGLRSALARRSVRVVEGAAVYDVQGSKRVTGATVGPIGQGLVSSGNSEHIKADCVVSSGGWNPVLHLYSQAGGKLVFDTGRACFRPDEVRQAVQAVGAAAAEFTLPECLESGWGAGWQAAAAAGATGAVDARPPWATEGADAPDTRALWFVPPPAGKRRNKHFVDQQNDSTAADLELAIREGFESVEHVKRYTTTGMATDQGKTSNVNALGIIAHATGVGIESLGFTTFRPPYTPVTFGTLAGRDVGELSDPVRVTAMQDWHHEAGAAFEDVGQWQRPWFYPRGGEDMHAAVARECLAVRNSVGILDASTLGKIDIQGRDAATLLNWVYVNAFGSLKVGGCRYGIMCHEDGMISDDGVTTRLGENHYLMTTTSGNAAAVLAWLELWLQTEWPELEVYCTSVTEQWATMALAGPNARALLAEVCDLDLANEAFPFMTMCEGNVAGVPARVSRISFTGELSYEVNVPANRALGAWQALMAAGAKYDITPYGTETMHVLRAEKGYIIVGQETDGTVTPLDLGMERMLKKKKDFIGKRSLKRSDTVRDGRKQLVGLLTDKPGTVLDEGAQLVEGARTGEAPVPMVGHVTSSYASSTLGHSIALALVKGGRERMGETLYASSASGHHAVTVVDPVFYDADGERLRG